MRHVTGLLLTALIAVCGLEAQAQSGAAGYPERQIRLIVPLSPGGAADVMGRIIADELLKAWGKPVIVENRPGAGSNIGVDAIAKAAPDGYTIGLANVAANAINPALYKEKLPFDPVADFAPLTLVAISPNVLVVNPAKIPATTVPELVAYLKANPGKVTFGSSGVGTSLHVGVELFMQMTGTQMVHVPYKGSAPMMADLLAGQVDLAIDGPTTAWPQVKAGKLRALAISTPTRAFFAPDLPTLSEFIPGLEITAWHGMVAPAGTPTGILAKLSGEIQRILAQPHVQDRLKQSSLLPASNSAEEFGAFMRAEVEKWKPIVERSGATLN